MAWWRCLCCVFLFFKTQENPKKDSGNESKKRPETEWLLGNSHVLYVNSDEYDDGLTRSQIKNIERWIDDVHSYSTGIFSSPNNEIYDDYEPVARPMIDPFHPDSSRSSCKRK